jgi:tRNA(adenine34) deaminase
MSWLVSRVASGKVRHAARKTPVISVSEAQGATNRYMALALKEAEDAASRSEVPVGAVLVAPDGRPFASDGNRTLELNDPTAHAEILVIRHACKATGSQRLPGFDLYVTLEPCAMCAAAISFARIRRLYFAADDPKSGGVEHGAAFFSRETCHHAPEVYGGICETDASALLKHFFSSKRGSR